MISPYVVAAMGTRAARRYFLNGESFAAIEAARSGLIHQVCKIDELGALTAQIVSELLAGKKGAQSAIMTLLSDLTRPRIDSALIEDLQRAA